MAAPFNWPARIDQTINIWKAATPDFLWAPTSQQTFLRDQAKGVRGTQVGNALVTYGGITAPIGGSIDGVSFPTVLGMIFSDLFMGVMLVSIDDPSAVQGAFLKIGDSTGGYGYGAGNTDFDTSGSRLVLLQEGRAWATTPSGFVKGLNILAFGRASDSLDYLANLTSTATLQVASFAGLSPVNSTFINGYYTNRSSNAHVHAVAIYRKGLTTAQIFAEGGRLCAPLLPMQGMAAGLVPRLFTPPRRPIFSGFAAGGGTSVLTLIANTTSAASILKAAKAQRQASTTAAAAIAKAASTSKAATATASAAITRSARLTRAATTTASAAVSKLAAAARSAAVSATATLATIKAKLLTLTASVTSSATARRAVSATRAATSTAAGTLAKAVTAAKAASTAVTATVGKAVATTKSASIAAMATIATVKAKLLTLAANITTSAAVSRTVSITRSATSTAAGAVAKAIRITRSATTSLQATLARAVTGGGLIEATRGYVAVSIGAARVAYSTAKNWIATR